MNKLNKIILWIIAIIIIAGLIWLGYSEKEVVEEGEVIKVGVLSSLTGLGSEHGNNSLRGLDLAKKEINKGGGISEKRIEFIYEDSQCNAKTGLDAFNKLVFVDDVKIIVGPVCSSVVLSIAQKVKENNILLLPAIASASDISQHQNIFRTYPNDTLQAKKNAEFIKDVLKAKKVAIIYINNDYGVGLRDILKSELEKDETSIVLEEAISFGVSDYKTQLFKVKSANPDVVFLGVYSKEMALLLKQSKEINLDTKILGGLGSNDPIVLEMKEASEGLIGGDWTYSINEIREKFLENYQNEYSIESGNGSPTAYDTLYLLKKAIEECSNFEVNCLKEELFKTKDYQGASGNITFDENGDVAEKDYNFFQIKQGKFIPYHSQ